MTQMRTPTSQPRRRRKGRIALRLRAARQLTRYLAGGGKWWLLPMLIIFLLTAIFVGIVQLVEYAAPFVYTIF